MKKWIFSLLIIIAFPCLSQTVSIKAVIIDSVTREPIAYAAVRLQNTSKGSITNNEGYFNLKLSHLEANDTLEISSVGYYTKRVPLSGQPLKEDRILLLPRFYETKEITISDTRISWRDTVSEALKKRMQNYVATPYTATAFYRQTNFSHIDNNGPKKEQIEAAFNLHVPEMSKPVSRSALNKNLGNKIKEDAQVTGIRGFYNGSLIKDMSFFAYKDHLPFNFTFYTELFTQNINLYYKSDPFLKSYNVYTLEKTDTLNDLIVYSIKLKKEKNEGRYCMLKVVQTSHQIIESAFFNRVVETNNKNSLKSVSIEQSRMIYQLLEGKAYPLYSSYDTDFKIYHSGNDNPVHFNITNYSLLYTNIQPGGKLPFDKKKTIFTGKDLVNQKLKYDEDFWKNYTILEE